MKVVKSDLLSRKRKASNVAAFAIARKLRIEVAIFANLEHFRLAIGRSGLSSLFPGSNVMTAKLFGRPKYTLPMAPRVTPDVSGHWCLSCTQHMTIKAVADYLHVGWDLVKDIQKQHLLRHYGSPNIRKLKRIAIDEIYMGKAAGYLCPLAINIFTTQDHPLAGLSKYPSHINCRYAKPFHIT